MLDLMQKSEIAVELAHIREIIRRDGEICVGCDELHFLCTTEVAPKALFTAVTEIAQWEHWELEFLADGRVRFFA